MKIYRKLIYEIDGLIFFLRNLNASRYLPILNAEVGENYTISPCSKDDIENLCSFHKLLRNDRVLNFWRKILYRKRGLKLVAIIKNIENDIIGFEMFYFKKYEAKNGIIHEAFIGIDEKYTTHSLRHGFCVEECRYPPNCRNSLTTTKKTLGEASMHTAKNLCHAASENQFIILMILKP